MKTGKNRTGSRAQGGAGGGAGRLGAACSASDRTLGRLQRHARVEEAGWGTRASGRLNEVPAI